MSGRHPLPAREPLEDIPHLLNRLMEVEEADARRAVNTYGPCMVKRRAAEDIKLHLRHARLVASLQNMRDVLEVRMFQANLGKMTPLELHLRDLVDAALLDYRKDAG